MLAVTEGYNSMVELLVEAGADLDAADNDGDTAVHIALLKAASAQIRGNTEPLSAVRDHNFLLNTLKYPL